MNEKICSVIFSFIYSNKKFVFELSRNSASLKSIFRSGHWKFEPEIKKKVCNIVLKE